MGDPVENFLFKNFARCTYSVLRAPSRRLPPKWRECIQQYTTVSYKSEFKKGMMTSLVDLGKRLLEASKKGHADEVSMLMTSGAPFTTDWLGTSPLHLAAQYGHTATAEVLLRAGVSRDARTKVDRTPIHLAAQHGHLGIVDLLIAGGASVNHTDMLNMTPLHWACESGHVEIVKLLLRNGANMEIESKFRQTPLDIARMKGFAEIVEILMSEETSDRSQGIKRQSQSSLTLGSIKKRQKTRKFPMTAGSWSGPDSPNSMGAPVLRTHSETMAPLVSAAALAISSEEKNSMVKVVKQEPTSSQDSSVLDALATLATATLHQTSSIPSAPTNTVPIAISTGLKQNVTLAPLTIPPNTSNPLLNNITPMTPPMWPTLAPLQSPLAALSAISALTSSPAQPSPLNIPMHQLPIALPLGFNSQSGASTSNQLFITQVPVAGQQTVTAPSSQSTVTVSSITGSAVSSIVDQTSSTSSDGSFTSTHPTAYIVPIMGGPSGQGHLFLSAPDGTPQLLLDSSHLNPQSTSVEGSQDKNVSQVNSQENVVQVQLSPAILQQAGQSSVDPQTARSNMVHSILTQVPSNLPQIQMALAQVLPNQGETQTQASTNTQNTPSQVLIQAVPISAAQQEQTSQPQQLTTDQLPATHQQLLQQLLQGQAGQIQVTEVIQNQSPSTTTQSSNQQHLITSPLPASAALQNLINQNLQGASGAQSSQAVQQQKVFVDLQKIVETQEREARARRMLEARLEEARRDSRKFQDELQQAQKEAESYKGRLQAIHKDKDSPNQKESVLGVSGVQSESSGEQLARQLFIQPGTLEGLETAGVNVMTANAVDVLSQVAQGSSSVAQVVVAETVVDEGDITCGVRSGPK